MFLALDKFDDRASYCGSPKGAAAQGRPSTCERVGSGRDGVIARSGGEYLFTDGVAERDLRGGGGVLG